ncbi:MAG: hypothetical protein APR54_05670 [Candidatus Cloacimonas sp. SDB]|nr:MAG: hypothetical protein APR54_05670 [Candidatus Cloacimonas sp. SDB]
MKIKLIILGIITIVFVSCRLTNPGSTNVNEAALIVENLTEELIYLTVEDGSIGAYPEHTVLPYESYSQTWEANDAVFVLNNGQVILRYRTEEGYEENTIIQLTVGFTSYYTIGLSNSILIVSNETNSDAWYTVDSGELNYLFSGEQDGISFGDLNSTIQINLFYSGYHVFSQNIELTIYPFNTQDYEINADAGAAKLINNSLSDIVEVYIAPAEDPYWGENLLGSILEPEVSAYWTVEPGWWDIRVVDEWGAYNDFLDNYISLDNTVFFTFRSTKNDVIEKETIPKIFADDRALKHPSKKVEFKEFSTD